MTHTPGSLLSISTVRPAYSLPREIWPLTPTCFATSRKVFMPVPLSCQPSETLAGTGPEQIAGLRSTTPWGRWSSRYRQEPVAHRSPPAFSADAPELAQISVTAMDLADKMGHREAQDLPALDAGTDQLDAAVARADSKCVTVALA
jgi:hypothetical protein